MSVTRIKNSSIKNKGPKYDNMLAGLPYTPIIGTATDGGTGTTASVTFTKNNTAGLTYTALSTPGSLTGTGTASPITVTGLTSGTAYTFAIKATNSAGDSAYSAASNSVTPVTPSSFESIATVTAAGGETSLSFTSIPGTYASLQVRSLVRTLRALDGSDSLLITFNSDSGANYSRHRLTGDGTTAAAAGSASNTSMAIINAGTVMDSSLANTFAANLIDIHDYASTTKNKTLRSFSGANANSASTSFVMGLFSSAWYSTSAVTSITFTNSFGFKAGSTFALYGIK